MEVTSSVWLSVNVHVQANSVMSHSLVMPYFDPVTRIEPVQKKPLIDRDVQYISVKQQIQVEYCTEYSLCSVNINRLEALDESIGSCTNDLALCIHTHDGKGTATIYKVYFTVCIVG